MRERLSGVLFAVAAIFVLWFVLSRLRIVVWVPMPWWGLLLLILGTLLILYLAIDHLINHTR